jgi:methylenetetrahydrofolate dehydrogenase (NADP+)/methenyltetrahydrofolate cyclohydrolase
VVAVGKPRLITADMVKPGAVVVDVGINDIPADPVEEPARRGPPIPASPERGRADGSRRRIVGDVDFEPVARKAAWFTPVPGGIGPLTNALLLSHLMRAAQRQDEARRADREATQP